MLHEGLKEIGFDVPIEGETSALVASGEGRDFIDQALAILLAGTGVGWAAFCSELGRALGQDVHEGLRSVFSRRNIVIRDEALSADIETDTPAGAIEALADPPDAPSRHLVWDRDEQRWKDSLD